MSNRRSPYYAEIVNEEHKKNNKKESLRKDKTLAQFQLNHCRYCKNKKSNLCEIRKNINDQYCCIYEENVYERRNIK